MRIGLDHGINVKTGILVAIWEGMFCLKFQHPDYPPTIAMMGTPCEYLPKWVTY